MLVNQKQTQQIQQCHSSNFNSKRKQTNKINIKQLLLCCSDINKLVLQLYLLNLLNTIGQPNKSIQATDNEAYGVLRGKGRGEGRGVYQPIELKDNAAYSTVLVNVQTAHNTMGTNADYEVISGKPDYVYEIPNI